LIVLGLFVFTGLVGGLIYESWDDITIELAMRGVYWNTPLFNFHFFLNGISQVITFLYLHVNLGINYFGFSLILLNLGAFLIFSYILFKSVKSYKVIISLLFLLIGYSNIYIIDFTRISILATFSGLLLYSYAIIYEKSKKLKIFILLSALFIMLYAYFLRPQGGLFAFILFAPFLIWFISFNNIPKKWLMVFYIVLPVFIILISDNIIISKIAPKPQYKQYEKYLGYGKAFEPKNQEQKMVMYITKKWFLADKDIDKKLISYMPLLGSGETKNMELFRKKKFSLLADRILWQFKTKIFLPFMKTHPLIFGFIFLFLCASIFLIKNNFKKVLMLIFFMFFYLSLIPYMFYYMKLENRVVIPLLTILVLFIIINIASFDFSFLHKQYKKTFLFIFLCGLLIFVFFQLKAYKVDFFKRNDEAQDQLGALYKFNKIENQDVVFLTFVSPGYNFYTYKHVEINKNKLQVPLIKWISFYDQNQITFKKLTGSEKIPDVVKWIANNPDKASLYSCPKENDNFRQIFAFYGLDVLFIPEKIMYGNGDGFYNIKIIN